jgi:hypothetical protein
VKSSPLIPRVPACLGRLVTITESHPKIPLTITFPDCAGVFKQCEAIRDEDESTEKYWLHSRRVDVEAHARHHFTVMQCRVSCLRVSYPPQQIVLNHLQDCCNKFTAIYLSEPGCNRQYIVNLIYKQWFKGHKTDVEFGAYPGKLIIPLPPNSQAISDIIERHRLICAQVEEFQQMLKTYDGKSELPNVGPFFDVDWRNQQFYRLLPLFRAMILVIDHKIWDSKSDQSVKMVLTGNSDGLSAPIKFDTIFGRGTFIESSSSNHVFQTSLKTAIRFVIRLEQRELRAFGDPLERERSRFDLSAYEPYKTPWPEVGPTYTWVDWCPGTGFNEESDDEDDPSQRENSKGLVTEEQSKGYHVSV